MKRINIYSVKQVKEKGGLYDLESSFIRSPEDANNIVNVVLDLYSESVEKFGILTLNTKNQVAGVHILSVGTLNGSMVHPREVFKAAVLNNAASIVCFHNHPSGDPTPSPEDIETTKRLVDAGELMGIQVLDHIVVGDNRFYSLKEQGMM